MTAIPRWTLVCGLSSLLLGALLNCGDHTTPTGDSPDAAPSGSGQPGSDADGGPGVGPVVGALDGGVDSGLPNLPALTNVLATEREDSVGIDFDPVEGAVDYRVYPLPAASDVTVNGDGSLRVKNGTYRCAGTRQTYDLENDSNTGDPNLTTFNHPYNWKAKAAADPTLGYVYPTPGAGLVPVYAVAGTPVQNELGWRESRPKTYTTDAALAKSLADKGGRDDGIVFYVPAAASASTHTIYASHASQPAPTQYYFAPADLGAHAKDDTPPAPAFEVLNAPAPGTQPLMAVLYQADQWHTELAVGKERFKRALDQGNGPLWHLEWAGITQPTILVVEALASGCPYQGHRSATHLDAPPHQPFLTLEDMRAASPTGEVFINGQYDGVSMSPVPIARSFVQVAPVPHKADEWDFYQGFAPGSDLGAITPIVPFDWPGGRVQTKDFDIGAYELDVANNVPVITFGASGGQLWESFDDTGQDVTGRMRFTARPMANVGAGSFLHVTMSVNSVATDRRYPQMIVTDQPAPIDCFGHTTCPNGVDNINGIGTASSNTMILQPHFGPSARLEVQAFHGLVNGGQWNVNNQAPEHSLIDNNPNYGVMGAAFAALNFRADPLFEHLGVDRMTRYDAYVSSDRMYVFVDGSPAGCTKFPSGVSFNGPVTVTFGDVLYHEQVTDEMICQQARPFDFLHRHQCEETSRHFDDLGFKSGVPAPAWDEGKLPCADY